MPEPATTHWASRLFRPIAEVRRGEALTAFSMFLYSFLAMTAHNVVKPITRSEFIASLGADNLPWVQFAAGILIGFIMQGYTRVMTFVPRRWIVPVTQFGLVALLVVFWGLFTALGSEWVAVAFYLLGLIMGILLISQFWTIANDVYDARQAKRLFGLIGGGASLGGATGAAITSSLVRALGSTTMLLVSGTILALCSLLVIVIIRRENARGQVDATLAVEERGVGAAQALRLLRESPHLQVVALVIGFVAVGAAIIEQQLNMAAAEAADSKDSIAALLAQVIVYVSLIGFFIQVLLTSRVHRILGIGFALLILPVSLGGTAILMLVSGAFWSAALARIVDSSLRYTIDKTSREVLFLPLPTDIKYRAKPFVDVSVDRFAKGLGALLLLVLIKDWGLGLDWRQLSYASLTIMGLWVLLALRARREYQNSFRQRVLDACGQGARAEQQEAPTELGPMDEQTTRRLVSQLTDPDERTRSEALRALVQRRERQPQPSTDAALVERLVRQETSQAFAAIEAHDALENAGALDGEGVLSRALLAKSEQSVDRVFQLLALVHPPRDIAAVQAALATGDPRARASAVEYIDNLLRRSLRRWVLPLVEDLPRAERVQRGAALYRRGARDLQEILSELARDADPTVAVSARDVAARRLQSPDGRSAA